MSAQNTQGDTPTPFSFSKNEAQVNQTPGNFLSYGGGNTQPLKSDSGGTVGGATRITEDVANEKDADKFSKFRPMKEKWKNRRFEQKKKKKLARDAWRQSGVGWRIFPRTLLGIVVSLLMFGLGAGVSGAVLFAYYEARVAESENKIVEFSANLDERIAQGVASIEESSSVAQQRLDTTLGPYVDLLQAENGIPQVVAPVVSSVALVSTRNLEGAEVIGTATAVGEENGNTILLTDFRLVEASTADPKPEIVLTKGDDRWVAELVSWDEELGLAFLSADTNLQTATFSPTQDLGSLTGAPVFALSALSDTVSPGAVLTVTRDGFRHTSVIDEDFMGGPIVNQRGEIVGFSTNGYSPSNMRTERLYWAPTIVQICETLLVCENGNGTPR